MEYSNNVGEVLFSEKQIEEKVSQIAKQINELYDGEPVTLVCILKGSYTFTADLARKLDMPVFVDFMQVSSYGSGTKSSGSLNIIKDINTPIDHKNVIIIEDIIDTGVTLYNLKRMFETRNPKSIKLCAFLDKPSRRLADINADFVGYTIPDHFVVGYGLDYDQNFRNLPYISILDKKYYEK